MRRFFLSFLLIFSAVGCLDIEIEQALGTFTIDMEKIKSSVAKEVSAEFDKKNLPADCKAAFKAHYFEGSNLKDKIPVDPPTPESCKTNGLFGLEKVVEEIEDEINKRLQEELVIVKIIEIDQSKAPEIECKEKFQEQDRVDIQGLTLNFEQNTFDFDVGELQIVELLDESITAKQLEEGGQALLDDENRVDAVGSFSGIKEGETGEVKVDLDETNDLEEDFAQKRIKLAIRSEGFHIDKEDGNYDLPSGKVVFQVIVDVGVAVNLTDLGCL